MDFIYIFKKIGILVILLIASAVLVIGKFTSFPLYVLFDAYFRFALYVIVIGIVSHFFPYILPKKYSLEKGLFACFAWEKNGKFYDEKFRVTKWKDSSMEASKIFAKKGRQDDAARSAALKNKDSLMAMIQGTCVSELVHWILILISPLLLFLIQSWLRWLLWVLYMFYNLKDVVIQRYNRPRFARLYGLVAKKGKSE